MTDMTLELDRLGVEPDGEALLLVFADAAGRTVRVRATPEQLDVLADLIDDALGTAAAD